MAIVTLPMTTRFAQSVAWTLDRPAQVNRSEYSGRRQVVANPWHGRWSAKVQLAPIVGQDNVLAWRAFLAALRGQVNSFRLPVSEGNQNANSGVTVDSTVAAGASELTMAGAATALKPGQWITVNDQALMLTSVGALVSGGRQILTFEPSLRAQANAGAAIETANPWALVTLASSRTGWSVGPGQLYGIELDVEEAF